MTEIRRLTDSAVSVTTDDTVALLDPGFHTFESGEFDLDFIGDVTRVLITHEHGDHVSPGFVRWLRERNQDLTVHCNEAVASILQKVGIEADTSVPLGVTAEDVLHEPVATGATPPNRAFTIDDVFTHPGDSRRLTSSAPVLALPLLVPWDSVRGAVEFALRLRPRMVVPIHDHYPTRSAREWVRDMARSALAPEGIEVADIDWGEAVSV